MTVAVTGAGGSIGRALVAFGARNGLELIAFPDRAQLDLAGPRGPLEAWLTVHRPTAIVHLAGRRFGDDAAAAFTDNVAATYNLLEAVRSLPAPTRVVVASSAAVYGEAPDGSRRCVHTPRRPLNTYGVAKALQEDVCTLARASSAADVSVARIFNIFGAPGDAWSVVPSLFERIRASSDGGLVRIANAHSTRDFVHVDDVCGALVLAATLPAVPPVFNVATGIGTTIGDVAHRIAHLLERRVDLQFEESASTTAIVTSIGEPAEALAMGWTIRKPFSDDGVFLKTFLP